MGPAAVAKVFISYTSKDRRWAFWIAEALGTLGHVAHVHEWELPPGGNIARWMRERLDESDHMAAVVSAEYFTKVYSGWELDSALWETVGAAANFVLPLFVEPCEAPKLTKIFKRCDLYGVGEDEARARLKDYLASGVRPPGPFLFPGRPAPPGSSSVASAPFPGARQPANLPFASLGDLFMGRDDALTALRAALAGGRSAAVAGRALHGLGGVGKTRLAIEYAYAHAAEYTALLFVRAEDASGLNAGLAALAAVLDLPEKEAREDAKKIEAALRWLEANPPWLMILDNVDDADAVAAVAALLPRLKGGHVIVTARAANFPPSLARLELDVLDEESATQFLLARTGHDREPAQDDAASARALARELGGLALGLEQAGAYIAKERIGFAHYRKLWNENRDVALAWNDPTLTGSEKTLATTWATSVARLAPESRRLLDRLALLAPDPIPDALLDAAVPGEAADVDARKARAGLFAYSLATWAKGEDGKGFVVHRLVQDFARRAMSAERREEALREALEWVDAAFEGDPQDVRNWPALDPLAPHALAVAGRADEAGVAAPTARLFNELGLLFDAKARWAEAEPLYRRALAIAEASVGPDHPDVASCLNNLAALLYAMNRLGEAEPLMRRALVLDEASLGADHPQVAIRLNNLALLLKATNRLGEAEPLMRRALAIGEATLGPDHPNVAIRLNNLARLLHDTNRLGEAEPLYRRALAIDEASFGPDHPSTATVRRNLAALAAARDRGGPDGGQEKGWFARLFGKAP